MASHALIASPTRRQGRFWSVWACSRAIAIAALPLISLPAFNLLQLVSLLLRPFSRRAYRQCNRWCARTWLGWCVSWAERFNGIRLIVTGDNLPDRENALVIANHQQMPDIPVVLSLARTKQRLGDVKFFAKKQLKWVPCLGWGMQFVGGLFIDRSWTVDADNIQRTFARLLEGRVPLWLISFVEGTRVTAAKLEKSRAFARSRGYAETRHVLVPRTKGFVASIRGLGSHIAAVYDLTIGYERGVPSLWQYINGSVQRVHVHARRFLVGQLPADQDQLSAWLRERFVQKDRLLDRFYRTGSFASEPAADHNVGNAALTDMGRA